jgi:hypothetical protein
MQEKTWYYEKWVGRQAAFSPSRYVKSHMKILPSIANKILLEVKMSEPNFCERYLWPLISLKFSRDFFPFHLG